MYDSTQQYPGAANTPTRIASTRTPCSWAVIQAPVGNIDVVRVFGSTTVPLSGGANPTQGGTVLQPGSSLALQFNGCPLAYDLSTVQISCANSADGVDVSFGK
jgi:hypothetical protein